MPSKQPLSVFIIAKNEADRISRTLKAAARLAQDIVVVDSGSSDDTVAVARACGARVFHNDWPGYGPQKRFGEEKCRHDWVVNLDADEVLSEAAIGEIKGLFADGPPQFAGYRLKVVTVYPGQDKPRLFADAYHIVRVYDRRRMRYSDSLTDDRVQERGQPLGDIHAPVWHHSFRKIEDIAPKLERYAQEQVQEKAFQRSKAGLQARMKIEYPFQMLRYLIGHRHITGGVAGFRYAHEIAKAKKKRLKIFQGALTKKQQDKRS